ncbi:substrate-binding periplasmic protein [Gilvimarinus polysaccharolyticus]|uniref:substrate-binding periplasmic protein n=1 Tax=Gilvimarinus polysaccharolyticus TaxID=863921 RepID=UPI0006737FDC|nr:ABC transporter substrate-binding protein [Gilvimarinus polysaccharolyticus]
MKKLMACLVLFGLQLSAVAGCGAPCKAMSESSCSTIVAPTYNAQEPADDAYYFTHLLTLALDLTVTDFGPYCLEQPAVYFSDDRLKAALQQGKVDVLWLATNQVYEQQMQAIPMPLLGELNHYRMLLIRRGDEAKFAKVQALEDLQALTGGMNSQWADAQVMADNNLPYVAVAGYSQLFRMLAAGRFDYFSRGIYQITSELDFYSDLDLVVEPHILLKYPSFTYFFVRLGDQHLARRITLGLKRAQQNGQFTALFQSIPRFRWAEQQLQANSRKVIRLNSAGPAEPALAQ